MTDPTDASGASEPSEAETLAAAAPSRDLLPESPPGAADEPAATEAAAASAGGPSQPIFIAAIVIALIAVIIAIVALVQATSLQDDVDAAEAEAEQAQAFAEEVARSAGLSVEEMEQAVAEAEAGQQSAETQAAANASQLEREREAASAAADSGLAVANLQAELKVLGYYDGEITGVYDDATTQAVAALQTDLGLPATGAFDQETADALDAALGEEAQADSQAISELQMALSELGYYDGPINGEYDDATEQAVAALQTDLGLEPTGDFDQRTAFELGLALDDPASE